MLDIRCFTYPDEESAPLRGDKQLLVGGDVTLLMSVGFDPLLESSELIAVRRRKEAEEEEERRRYDDDD